MKAALMILLAAGLAAVSPPAHGTPDEKTPAATQQETEPGSRLYQQRGCGACHVPDRDQTPYGLGPSLKQIAEAYQGQEDRLAKFLRGGCQPVMEPGDHPVMHGQIVKLRDLSDAEIKELAGYLLRKR